MPDTPTSQVTSRAAAAGSAEHEALIETLATHRAFLLGTAEGLTEQQARTASTVSELTIASLLKHVADTEEQWVEFTVRGAEAFNSSGVYESDVDWEAVDSLESAGGDSAQDPRFVLSDAETLDVLRARVAAVAARTEDVLRAADLDASHPLPAAPWFEPGASRSTRRVALHLIAEISQHAGHADIIREAIDGRKSMG